MIRIDENIDNIQHPTSILPWRCLVLLGRWVSIILSQTKMTETGAPSLRCGHCGEDLPSQLHLCLHHDCNHHRSSPLLYQDLEAVLGSQSRYYMNNIRIIDKNICNWCQLKVSCIFFRECSKSFKIIKMLVSCWGIPILPNVLVKHILQITIVLVSHQSHIKIKKWGKILQKSNSW